MKTPSTNYQLSPDPSFPAANLSYLLLWDSQCYSQFNQRAGQKCIISSRLGFQFWNEPERQVLPPDRQAGYPHGKSQAFFFPPITVFSSIFFLWLGLDEHPFSFSPLLIVVPTSWSHLTTAISFPTTEPHSPYQRFHFLPHFSHHQKPNLLLFPVQRALLPI